jgi:uncharacterized membrane protein (UPF0182 family)
MAPDDNVRPFPPRKAAPRKRPPGPVFGKRSRIAVIVIAALVAVVAIFYVFLRYYVDWLWYREVGLLTVFWTRITTSLIVGPAFAILFFAILYGNLEIARRLAPKFRPVEGIDVYEYVQQGASKRVRQVGIAAAAVVAIIIGFSTAGSWLTFSRAFNAASFGTKDPIFHHDLSFYVFTVPALQYISTFIFWTLVVSLLVTFAVHMVLGGIRPEQRGASPLTSEGGAPPSPRDVANRMRQNFSVQIEHSAISHLSALLGVIFIVTGTGYFLKAWGLLYSSSGVAFGAGATDVNVRLPLIRVLMGIAWLLGVALIYNAFRGRRRLWPPIAVGGWIVALIVLLGIVPAVYQPLVVNPNQLAKESPFIARNIAATRAGFNLTAISETPYSLQGDLTASALQTNSETIRNIRLWDPEVLLRSYAQLQELRPYYSFTTVSVDRYNVNGVERQTMLAPRELNIAGLPSQAQTWVNQHITYTHGYGVALSAVNQISSGGAPDFLVQDVPVISSAPTLAIAQPRIYYGLLGTNYVLVNTKDKEFDYPGPGGDVYQPYTGTGGIPVNSFLNRLAFAVRFNDIRFFTSSAITSGSKVILYDNIRARLQAAAPFLTFDSDPYMVIANGKLYWMADAYTTSDRMPYSQPNGGINYIRNSVKVVLDAYNGSMSFYVFDPTDPLIRTYEGIYPNMFKPAADMPQDLRAHVRYPQDYFNTQAQVFSTYHVTDPGLLYNKGNQWDIPNNVSISGTAQMSPYYTIMRLPGQTQEEFVLILPYTPNGRTNMIAWLGAQSDQPNYGKAVSFQFPSSLTVYGPAQVEAAVNQDPTISSQRTLWGQQGSTVIFGNLLTIPVENSLLYVQPLYLESSTTKLPQIQRVIVFYRSPNASPNLPTGQQQNVVMEPTLGTALTDIFGGSAPPGTGGGTPTPTPTPSGTGTPTPTPTPTGVSAQKAALIAQAEAEYQAAQAALRAANLTEYGKQIDALGATLAKLKALP